MKIPFIMMSLRGAGGGPHHSSVPTKLVRLIISLAAGGASNGVARIAALKLTKSIGQSNVMGNWLGALAQMELAIS
jgi:tripartite-type tricarboxylate transporter receptor subunit TctC